MRHRDMLRQGSEGRQRGGVNRRAGSPAETHQRLAGQAVADTRPSRPAVPLTVSTLQYPLDLVFADDDAMACAESRNDTRGFIRRFMVPGGYAYYIRGARRSRMAFAPARFLLQQVPGHILPAHRIIPRRALGGFPAIH